MVRDDGQGGGDMAKAAERCDMARHDAAGAGKAAEIAGLM